MNPRSASETVDAVSAAEGQSSCAAMSLHELARRVAEFGDATALSELHQRTTFLINGTQLVCLVMFVDYLHRQAFDHGNGYADRAYDLTIDKFSRLDDPSPHKLGDAGPTYFTGIAGPDCQHYFKAFVRYLDRKQSVLARMSALEREVFEAKALQMLVRRHFFLSLREAQRTAFMTRYVWHLPAGNLTLLMPRSLVGRARRRWLEAHVPDADPTRSGEQMRVQAIIDARVGQSQIGAFGQEHLWMRPAPIPGTDVFSVSADGLADAVAKEKTASLQDQRPAIRALGPVKLQTMIHQIFDDLADQRYCLADVAKQYGLSKATLSRFAGTRWDHGGGHMINAMPDLWLNTARVIGSDPDFVDAAKRAGIWQQIKQLEFLVQYVGGKSTQ
jgi:hypothetical protein